MGRAVGEDLGVDEGATYGVAGGFDAGKHLHGVARELVVGDGGVFLQVEGPVACIVSPAEDACPGADALNREPADGVLGFEIAEIGLGTRGGQLFAGSSGGTDEGGFDSWGGDVIAFVDG